VPFALVVGCWAAAWSPSLCGTESFELKVDGDHQKADEHHDQQGEGHNEHGQEDGGHGEQPLHILRNAHQGQVHVHEQLKNNYFIGI